jgi:hypothetical protein
MAKLTPMQEVKQRFGTKQQLADKLIPTLDRPEGEEDADFTRRIATASNKQLLRLHAAQEAVSKDFGSKEGLVDAIVAKKFPKGNDPYRTKLLTKHSSSLLDLYRSL